MSKFALVAVAFALPAIALGGKMPAAEHAATADADAASDPAACARKADLVQGACRYTTGMMAQRVLSEGKPWSFTGSLTKFDGALDSHVAAAFTVGPDSVYVVANEVLESLTASGGGEGRFALEGRQLEVDGVRYFVLTSFAAANS